MIVLTYSNCDANAISTAIVAGAISDQNAACAHFPDERLREIAEIEQNKIRAAGPEPDTPHFKAVFELAPTLECLANITGHKILIG